MSEKATLVLTVRKRGASFTVLKYIAGQRQLDLKKEFHITIIGTATGKAILENLSGLTHERGEAALLSIDSLSKEFPWTYSVRHEYYALSKSYDKPGIPHEVRRSIIQLAVVPDLLPFYARLNALLGTHFEVPFPHITLFAGSTRPEHQSLGIGIYTKEEFRSLKPEKINIA